MESSSQLDDLEETSASTDDDRSSFHARLLDSIFDGVYFVDADRRITYWNQGSESLTGYSAREAVGRHCYDNFLVHVDLRAVLYGRTVARSPARSETDNEGKLRFSSGTNWDTEFQSR
jgi:PAS domain S-box-containing protein